MGKHMSSETSFPGQGGAGMGNGGWGGGFGGGYGMGSLQNYSTPGFQGGGFGGIERTGGNGWTPPPGFQGAGGDTFNGRAVGMMPGLGSMMSGPPGGWGMGGGFKGGDGAAQVLPAAPNYEGGAQAPQQPSDPTPNPGIVAAYQNRMNLAQMPQQQRFQMAANNWGGQGNMPMFMMGGGYQPQQMRSMQPMGGYGMGGFGGGYGMGMPMGGFGGGWGGWGGMPYFGGW